MKCINHPKSDAVALLDRRITLKRKVSGTSFPDEKIEFRTGVCDKCFAKWLDEKGEHGWDVGDPI